MFPNGGEVLFYGVPKTIHWSALNTSGNVKIEYSTDNGATWQMVISTTPNTGSFTWNQIPNLYAMNCYIKVTHLTNGWTDTSNHPFAILNNAPVPVPTSPANLAASVPTNPQLSWQPTIGSLSYQVQLATDADFDQMILEQDVISHTYLNVSNLNPFTTYYWHVSAVSEIGAGDFSETQSFVTGEISVVPSIPVMLSPANSATDLPANLEFSWEASFQADSYELEIGLDYYFTQMVAHQESLSGLSYPVTHLLPQTTYFWRIRSHNVAGYSNFSIIRNFTTGNYTANDDHTNAIVTKNDLFPNYPNPFNPTTTITFSNKENKSVKLEIYNIRGQKIVTLVNAEMQAGMHNVVWQGTDRTGVRVASGMYFSKLTVGKEDFIRKMLLLK
jgi:hypothetical protein